MATPPTLIDSQTTVFNNATTPKTVALTVVSGDVLTAKLSGEDFDLGASGVTDTQGNTWTLRNSVRVSTYTVEEIWTAVAGSGGSLTVSLTAINTGAGQWWGGRVNQYRGSDGIGNTSKANASAAPSLAVVTQADNSTVEGGLSDWNATDGTSRAWRTINSITPSSGNGLEQTYFRDPSHFSTYKARWNDAGAAGTKTGGLTTPSQKYSFTLLEVKGAASGGISGSAGVTLDNVTTSATGTVAIGGALAVSLANVTLSAASSLAQRGAASIALGDATLTGAGSLAIRGAAALALGDATVSAAGASQKTGAAAITLGQLGLAAAGALAIRGQASITLAGAALSAAGVLPIAGATSLTLGNVTLSAAGLLTTAGSGQAAIALAALTLSAAGVLPIAGTAGLVLANATLAASGLLTPMNSGQAAISLAGLTMTAAGVLPLRGVAGVALDAMTVSAAGRVTLRGSASLTLGNCTIVAAGSFGEIVVYARAPAGGGYTREGARSQRQGSQTSTRPRQAPSRRH